MLTIIRQAIESNVRYVARLLPSSTRPITLFADGNLKSDSVLYDDSPDEEYLGERVYALLFDRERPAEQAYSYVRPPRLGVPLDGASRSAQITRAFTKLNLQARQKPRTALLYFTGHGSQNEANTDNNAYALWGDDNLSVTELSRQIARLPRQVPVALVMVQCYSGSFGNVLFEGGNPRAPLVNRDIVGFFAATKERMAAGCTSAVDEAEYHDFTSYFFAALCGRDRVGRKVTGADFNRDGRVGMNEAFHYTLVHDESIDVPVCTSDVFVRRFVQMPQAQLSSTRFSLIRAWATPSQRAALDALSSRLRLAGEGRLKEARRRLSGGEQPSLLSEIGSAFSEGRQRAQAEQQFEDVRLQAKNRVLARWPVLKQNTPTARAARAKVQEQLGREAISGKWAQLLRADAALSKIDYAEAMQQEQLEIRQSRLMRFVRLSESVILGHHLQSRGTIAQKAQFARIQRGEARTLLPPASFTKSS
jgi:hypothetical protein